MNSDGYYYITDCFYSKRKAIVASNNKDEKKNDDKVNAYLSYYPSNNFDEINQIINAK